MARPRARRDRRASGLPGGARPTADLTELRAPAVLAEGWGVRHPGRRAWALDGLDLRVEAGERILLLGPSGAGKSTLLLALAGLLDPESVEHRGRLLVHGKEPRMAEGQAGVLFQDPESQLVMGRVGDDVAFGLENLCVPAAEIPGRVREALEGIGFPNGPNRSTDALSGGEKQLLALAGTLALRPRLLLLDEPTANLDSAAARRLRAALSTVLAARESTLIVVEHRVDEWLDLVDRVVVIAPGGGVTADMTPAEMRARDPDQLARQGIWPPAFSPTRRRPAQPAGAELIRANDVRSRYPGEDRDAVGPVSDVLRQAEVLAIRGPNGSGKSTLALTLGGLLHPSGGTVTATRALDTRRNDQRVATWPSRALASRIGHVFQDPEHQFLTGSVRDELMLGPLRLGLDRAAASARAVELMERLRLSAVAEANPFTLSGGEQRRLSVATALANAPSVLVLDEPTFGQDPTGWTELLSLLAGLRDEGHAIAIATHDEPLVVALADRTLALERTA